MTARGTAGTSRARSIGAALLVFVAYYIGARLGFALTLPDSPVSTLWAPNALLLAAFLLTPARSWWFLLLAAVPAHLAVELTAGVPPAMVLSWFVSNASEALIGAVLVRRFSSQPPRLDSVSAAARFVLFAAFAAPILSSFLDAGLVQLNGWGDASYWEVFRIRSLSNALAAITLIPVVLAWGEPKAPVRSPSLARLLEAAFLGAGLLAVSVAVFGRGEAGEHAIPGLMYAPLPFLLWSVVRFGPKGSSTALLLVVLVATWNAAHGRGPFLLPTPEANALTIQLLFIIVAVMLIFLAAVIEERGRAEEKARRKGEQLQLALDAAQLGTWDWHLTDDRAEWSEESRRMLGLAAAHGTTFDDLLGSIHPGDRPAVTRAIDRAIERGATYQLEFRVVTSDDTVRWVSGKGKVLRDPAGRPGRLIGIHADITDHKLAEAASAGENRILGMVAAGAPLADILTSLVLVAEQEFPGLLCSILLLDPDGVHVRSGAAPSLPASFTSAIEGLAIGPTAGSCGTAMYRGETVVTTDILTDPLWDDYRELAAAHGLRACWSAPIVSKEGQVLGSFASYHREPHTPRPAEVAFVDTATHLAAIAIDRQRAELEANVQRRELAHLGRVVMLGQLSSSLAHELKQPLAAIMSNAQAARRLLEREPPPLDDVRDILADIVASDRRARDVIDHLRAMLLRGQQELVPLDLNEVIAHTLQLARRDLAAREVTVGTDMADRLPAVLGDPVQLTQVILNLVMNACDAMASNAPYDRRLHLATRTSGEESVECALCDRGTGIPAELIDRVFEPFVSSKEHGLGLGLSICRSIVTAHGGRLWAGNNDDRGATFHVRLPAVAGLEVSSPRTRPAAAHAG
jgi:PAS domain S-box-containing protein